MKTKYNFKGLVKRAFSYIARATEEGKNLGRIKEDLRELVNSYSGLNRNERYWLYDEILGLARKCKSAGDNWQEVLGMRSSFDSVLRVSRKVKRDSELRAKKQAAYLAMHTVGIVFYLCSWHPNPADDHKDYQGRIYVDRFWRSKVKGRDYYAVDRYIKNHNIMTIQEVMGEPVWLSTRPYCRHYFIALDTGTVLHNSRNKIVKEYGMTYEKGWDTEGYYKLRDSVYENLDNKYPHRAFKRKIKKRG